MAVETITTNNLRYHFALGNGGTRFIDVENPIDDNDTIKTNINTLNERIISDTAIGDFSLKGILVGKEYFDGDSDAVVTSITSAEKIQVQKTTTTTAVPLT